MRTPLSCTSFFYTCKYPDNLILQLYTPYISPIPISITIAKSKRVEHRTEIFWGTKVHKEILQPSDLPELQAFLANPRSRQAAVKLLYSSRNIFKPGFVETFSDNVQGKTINSANKTRNIVWFNLAACEKTFSFLLFYVLRTNLTICEYLYRLF